MLTPWHKKRLEGRGIEGRKSHSTLPPSLTVFIPLNICTSPNKKTSLFLPLSFPCRQLNLQCGLKPWKPKRGKLHCAETYSIFSIWTLLNRDQWELLISMLICVCVRVCERACVYIHIYIYIYIYMKMSPVLWLVPIGFPLIYRSHLQWVNCWNSSSLWPKWGSYSIVYACIPLSVCVCVCAWLRGRWLMWAHEPPLTPAPTATLLPLERSFPCTK